MPIHLAPISRRRFLARTFAAGAALAVGPEFFAQSKSASDSFWALLSDTHISGNRHRVFLGANMADHFGIITREILDSPKRPAGILVSGDCAWAAGEKYDYHTFANLLTPMRAAQIPVHLTLGNHDNRHRFWDVLKEEKHAKHPVDGRQMSLVRAAHVNWFILDSLQRTLYIPGFLGHDQLTWLAATLDLYPDKPALIMVHHNLGSGDKSIALQDAEKFFKIVRPRKQVKACFFGHTHIWNVKQDDSGIHLVNLPPTSYPFIAGDPTGWVRAKSKPDGMELELRCVDQHHKAHGQIVDLKWRDA